VIGSEKVAEFGGQPIYKPGYCERAADQLAAASGRTINFHTAVTLYRHSDRRAIRLHDTTRVRFRTLAPGEIERYLHAEQPYDCAGSFKAEGLGITLFEAIDSRDPTALIGLPLIGLAQMLREAGYTLP
jgi:septum formation protein